MAAFPIKAVYIHYPSPNLQQPTTNRVPPTPCTQILISVPKKRLHHAVDRNRAKRQMREAYRLNKHLLEVPLAVAFIWLADAPMDSHCVNHSMRSLLQRLAAANGRSSERHQRLRVGDRRSGMACLNGRVVTDEDEVKP